MTTPELYFESYEAYEDFRTRELLPKYPQGCLSCHVVTIQTIDMTDHVDRGEKTEEEAVLLAIDNGNKLAADCTYGYTRSKGCSIGVLCR